MDAHDNNDNCDLSSIDTSTVKHIPSTYHIYTLFKCQWIIYKKNSHDYKANLKCRKCTVYVC